MYRILVPCSHQFALLVRVNPVLQPTDFSPQLFLRSVHFSCRQSLGIAFFDDSPDYLSHARPACDCRSQSFPRHSILIKSCSNFIALAAVGSRRSPILPSSAHISVFFAASGMFGLVYVHGPAHVTSFIWLISLYEFDLAEFTRWVRCMRPRANVLCERPMQQTRGSKKSKVD
jgi:hypothetical protein